MDALEILVSQAERFEHPNSKGGQQMQRKKTRSVAPETDEPKIITPPEFSDVALAVRIRVQSSFHVPVESGAGVDDIQPPGVGP